MHSFGGDEAKKTPGPWAAEPQVHQCWPQYCNSTVTVLSRLHRQLEDGTMVHVELGFGLRFGSQNEVKVSIDGGWCHFFISVENLSLGDTSV